jgi:hypothetical protein
MSASVHTRGVVRRQNSHIIRNFNQVGLLDYQKVRQKHNRVIRVSRSTTLVIEFA